jgi:diadenosine tetraphosphate (Ap4A) HIT family hydrolase
LPSRITPVWDDSRKQKLPISLMIIFKNDHFHLSPCYACPLPGYVILAANNGFNALHELPQPALSALGPTLAAISRAIQTVLAPERIYLALFCEAQSGVHFHIFPRTAWLRESYLSSYPSEELLDGPRLLSWARKTFAEPIPEFDLVSINTALRDQLARCCT